MLVVTREEDEEVLISPFEIIPPDTSISAFGWPLRAKVVSIRRGQVRLGFMSDPKLSVIKAEAAIKGVAWATTRTAPLKQYVTVALATTEQTVLLVGVDSPARGFLQEAHRNLKSARELLRGA